MNIGDRVVYLKNGITSQLGNTRKDIWKIINITPDAYSDGSSNFQVESISKPGKIFDSAQTNFVDIEYLRKYGKFKKEFFIEKAYHAAKSASYREAYSGSKTESKDMSRNDNMIKRTTDSNVDAAKVAATITAGKTLNSLVAQKITPQLPLLVRGYADTPVGRVVLANIADFAVKQFMANNVKANMATTAMMQAAMFELADSFDLEGIVNELVDSVALDVAE